MKVMIIMVSMLIFPTYSMAADFPNPDEEVPDRFNLDELRRFADTASNHLPHGVPEAYQNHCTKGTKLMESRPGEAAIEFKRAAKLNPDEHRVLLALALAYYMNGNEGAALRELENAARRFPGKIITHSTLLWIYMKTGKTDKALDAATRALKQMPNNVQLNYNFLTALLAKVDGATPDDRKKIVVRYLDQYKVASEIFQDIYRSDNNNFIALLALIDIAIINEFYDDSSFYLGKAKTLYPANSVVMAREDTAGKGILSLSCKSRYRKNDICDDFHTHGYDYIKKNYDMKTGRHF